MKKTNVLWIFSDQHRACSMGFRGDENVKTPNIDSLAEQGTSFDRAYSSCPICSPFRASLMTSKHIHEHGVVSLHVPLINQKTIAETMQENGFHTGYLGKWHISGGAAPSHFVSGYFRQGFDDFIGWENSNRLFETAYFKSTDRNPQKFRVLDGFQTDALTDLAIEYLHNQDSEKPWFTVVSYEAPHAPYTETGEIDELSKLYAPADYISKFDDKKIAFQANVDCTLESNKNLERELKAYYAAIENLDHNIGRLCKSLEELGELDNTIIFYFSDHGALLGSHNRAGKARPEEESSNIPMIIRYPRAVAQGQRTDKLFSGIDIAPTTLGLIDAIVPSYMSGMDLSHIAKGELGKDRAELLIQFERSTYGGDKKRQQFRTLITDEFKFTHFNIDQSVTLYCIKNDPCEMDNLALKPEYKSVVEKYKQRLKENLVAMQDEYYTYLQ